MEIEKILISAGLTILLGVVSAVSTFLINFLRTKTTQAKIKVTDEKTKKYLEILDEAIKKSVIAVNQTFVDSLKESGKFEKDEQKRAFEKAFSRVFNILSEEAIKTLEVVIPDIKAYIGTQIEANVKLAKEDKIEQN